MNQLIISVSGLRGIIGRGLTPGVAMQYCAAFAEQAPAGPLVVARDGRNTGPMLADAVTSALCAMGRDVLQAGIAATPTVGVLIRDRKAAGGVQISASHNPPEYNGLKLFGPDGRVIAAEQGQGVLDLYQRGAFHWALHQDIGTSVPCESPHQAHLEAVLRIVDVPRIRQQQFSVLLDSNHGAGSLLGRALLEQLGARATILGDTPDGDFEHAPEPTAANLQHVGALVVRHGAAVGFCQDPDADRLALIDETGRYVGEEFTVAVCLDQVLRTLKGPVVTNCSTSRMAEDLAHKHQVPFTRSKVGEANVTEEMLAQRAVFGGEGNGGPIDPRVGYVRDSFVGMALVLDAMAARGKSLSQLVSELPQYAIHKDKFEYDTTMLNEHYQRLERHFADARSSRLDGLRLDWPDRWLLIRPSNTEPIVRIIAEAPTEQAAAELCREAAKIVANGSSLQTSE